MPSLWQQRRHLCTEDKGSAFGRGETPARVANANHRGLLEVSKLWFSCFRVVTRVNPNNLGFRQPKAPKRSVTARRESKSLTFQYPSFLPELVPWNRLLNTLFVHGDGHGRLCCVCSFNWFRQRTSALWAQTCYSHRAQGLPSNASSSFPASAALELATRTCCRATRSSVRLSSCRLPCRS